MRRNNDMIPLIGMRKLGSINGEETHNLSSHDTTY